MEPLGRRPRRSASVIHVLKPTLSGKLLGNTLVKIPPVEACILSVTSLELGIWGRSRKSVFSAVSRLGVRKRCHIKRSKSRGVVQSPIPPRSSRGSKGYGSSFTLIPPSLVGREIKRRRSRRPKRFLGSQHRVKQRTNFYNVGSLLPV